MHFKNAVGILVSGVIFAGCTVEPFKTWNNQLRAELNALSQVAQGKSSPLGEKPAVDSAAEMAKAAQVNAEVLQEIFRVVWIQETIDRSQFGNWVDSANQGASFDGIFNGFVHSAEFKKLEETYAKTPHRLVDVFAEELSWLLLEMPTPTVLNSAMAKPIARPDLAGMERQAMEAAAAMVVPPIQQATIRKRTSADDQEWRKLQKTEALVLFTHASPFTMKRVLGSEALKLVSAYSGNRARLARWYGRFCERMKATGTDFGLRERNQGTAEFHERWALEASEAMLSWEILNRLQRHMNQMWKTLDPESYPKVKPVQAVKAD
ncbi:MAG: hypothetical protein JNL01_07105 [Bdellovibrionales bacterium]|nr:hypothetical protein [Bdellovibrionales bacterium]